MPPMDSSLNSKIRALPLWLRASLKWGFVLLWLLNKLSWVLSPAFTRHYERAKSLRWAAAFLGAENDEGLVDSWDKPAQHAWWHAHNPGHIEWLNQVRGRQHRSLMALEPRPGAGEALAGEVVADLDNECCILVQQERQPVAGVAQVHRDLAR
jgi:hypothetical protein